MKRAFALLATVATIQAQVFEFDQGFDSGASGGLAILDSQTLKQTFTVGIEGTLEEIRLNLFHIGNPNDDLVLSLYRPTGEKVHFQYVPLTPIPEGMENSTMVSIPMTRDLDLQFGSTWEMRLTSGDSSVFNAVEWSRAGGNPYAGGEGWANDQGTLGDFSFFTFMSPKEVPVDNLAAIPESGTYVMVFAVGLLGFVAFRKLKSA